MSARRALITGVTGQDGSYLAELLLDKGYEVHGLIRRCSTPSTGRLPEPLREALIFHPGDMTDASSLAAALERSEPDEIYNLAAQSHVGVSFEQPVYTADVIALGTARLLEAVRTLGLRPRLYQASTSELFGGATTSPQRESTPFAPRSPYAAAKAFAHRLVVLHREAHGLHASNGILFNHESPRRAEGFVTRKITRAVGRIAHGLQEQLVLGNLEARRDWGFAGDYVEAMWRMLQQPSGGDYVVATGHSHSVAELCALAFGCVGLDWRAHVVTDPTLHRPLEVDEVVGDASRARQRLGWRPTLKFEALVSMMVEADLQLAAAERQRYG